MTSPCNKMVITEAKLDNMVANDQAYDSHASNGILLNNNVGYYQKDSGGTNRAVMNLDASDLLTIGDGTNMETAIAMKTACRVYLSANQENLVDATFTTVELDTEAYDVGSDFNTTTHVFTAPVTGYYFIQIFAVFSNVVADKRYNISIYVDGSRYFTVSETLGTDTDAPYLGSSGIVKLTAAETVVMHARSDSGDNTVDLYAAATSGTEMSIHLIGV